jgi:C4-dicarboxylate transporter DctQ subunit
MLDAVSREANRVAEWIMACLLAVMTLLVGAQIAGRFLFGYSIYWSDEAARFLLIWIAFLGMSAGVRRGAHLGVDSLVRTLPPEVGRFVAITATVLALAFFAVMLAQGSLLVSRTWLQRSPSLGLPMGIPYLAVPTAGLLMLLHGTARWMAGGPAEAGGHRGG